MIRRSIMNTNVTKESLSKDEDNKNDIKMNTKNEDINNMYSALIKDKDKKFSSEQLKRKKCL